MTTPPWKAKTPAATVQLISAAIAGNLVRVKEILPSADINAADGTGMTPVLASAIYDHHETASHLVHMGANLSHGNDLGKPVHWFAARGWADLVERAMQLTEPVIEPAGYGPTATDAFRCAVRCDKEEIVTLIAARADWSGVDKIEYLTSALREANTAQMVDRIVDLGANVNAPNRSGETPIFSLVRADAAEACRQIVARGASANHMSDYATPLYVAAINNKSAAMLALLEAGADDRRVTPEGKSLSEVLEAATSVVKQVYAAWQARNAMASVAGVVRARAGRDQ